MVSVNCLKSPSVFIVSGFAGSFAGFFHFLPVGLFMLEVYREIPIPPSPK